MLIGPERIGVLLGTADDVAREDVVAELVRAYGDGMRDPQELFIRRWGVDPWTQGYVTQWQVGDVMAVGPLHGTHEPPFYVCGSDQWVCGYMEGAVRTGRARRGGRAGPGCARSAATGAGAPGRDPDPRPATPLRPSAR